MEPAGQQPGGDVFDQFGPGRFDLGELLGDAGSEFKTRHRYLGLTYPRCPVPVDVMLDSVMACSKTILGVRGVQEHHKDGTPHCQMLVQRKAKCHDISTSAFHVDYEGHVYRCHIRHLKTRVHQGRWHAYLSKEGEPQERGQYEVVRVSLKPVELLDVARNEGITVALDHFVECGGYLSKVASVKKGLEIMIPEPRWVPPPWKIVLYPWQKCVWEVVNAPPSTRR